MQYLTVNNKTEASKLIRGTGNVGTLVGPTYDDLVKLFGQPTWTPADDRDKVQVEWVVRTQDGVATIYDYKSEALVTKVHHWSVGGAAVAGNAIGEFIASQLNVDWQLNEMNRRYVEHQLYIKQASRLAEVINLEEDVHERAMELATEDPNFDDSSDDSMQKVLDKTEGDLWSALGDYCHKQAGRFK